MMADALSDAVLALVCAHAFVVARSHQRAALGIGVLLMGLAASVGTLRYAGLETLAGPHRFLSQWSASASFLLLLSDLRWPQGPVASRWNASAHLALLLGGAGILMGLLELNSVARLLPVLGVLGIAWTAREQRESSQRHRPWAALAAVALVLAFAATLVPIDAYAALPFNGIQALHYLLAVGVLGLVRAW